MSVNVNWHRWLEASANKKFSTYNHTDTRLNGLSSGVVPIYYSTLNRETVINSPHRIEMRVHDIGFNERSKDNFFVSLYIDLMAISLLDPKDIYAKNRVVGMCTSMHSDFDAYRYGPDVSVDDETWLMCLKLTNQGGDQIRTTYLGESKNNFTHTLISGYYTGYIGT